MSYLLLIVSICLLVTIGIAISIYVTLSDKVAERNTVIDGLLKINDEQKHELLELKRLHGYIQTDDRVKVRVEHHPAQNAANANNSAFLGLLLGMQARK